MVSDTIINNYKSILKEELVPALGCTEPIALAYCSAFCRDVLSCIPDRIVAYCSGNIIKNVSGVVVPNCNGLKGIKAAIAIGIMGGIAEKELEVLTNVTQADIENAIAYLEKDVIEVKLLETTHPLHIIIECYKKEDKACVEIVDRHTNIVKITNNDKILLDICSNNNDNTSTNLTDRSILNIKDIIDFIESADLSDIAPIIEQEIKCNTNISQEGLKNNWGACIGKNLLLYYGNDINTRAKAVAAAGSDARMSGCTLPVMINSGSGNQGMTVSLPVIEFAKEWKKDEETTIKALVLSNLVAIQQKSLIGPLSAYCGAINAACGAGAAITWMAGGNITQIENTITNVLANVSGIICDGAKPSCAIKIASAVDAAIMGYNLAMHNTVFKPGEGIVKNNIQDTIAGVGVIASKGMENTDKTILSIMIN